MTLVFLPKHREAHRLHPNPHWSPSQGCPRKGQALGWVTPWIAPGLPHAQVGLQCAFWQVSLRPLPMVFTIKLIAKTSLLLFPLVHGGGHTTNAVGVVSQDYKPCQYKQCVQEPYGKRCAKPH
jgi:hypothetical protein